MVFSSHIFLFYFLPLSLITYYVSPRRTRHFILTLLSYLFYGWSNPLFVLLMLASTLIDYIAGLVIANPGNPPLQPDTPRSRLQKMALIISICSNLGILGFFKYFNFATENYDAVVLWLGFPDMKLDLLYRITLPLGISFYTFQSMSYTIDIYRGEAKPVRNFINFSCYVAMFPQLVAGPIIRFREVSDQLLFRTHTLEKMARGIAFFGLGLGKKILLANPCGKIADSCFDALGVYAMDAWYGAFAYAFQIYFDFSAYSDMAIGLGLMFGFVFTKNFDSPYCSKSITDFWRRWHISLSTWLRDNLYLPLGGNRKGESRTYFNLFVVMLLGGFWHGASWNFIAWGTVHGIFLALERVYGKKSFYKALPAGLQIAITFFIVTLAWVFFRTSDLTHALDYFQSMFGLSNPPNESQLLSGLIYQPYYVLSFAAAAIIAWSSPQTWDFTRSITWPKIAWIFTVMILAILILTTQSFNPFIYFIF